MHSGQRSRSFRVGHYHSEIAEGGIVHVEEGEGTITKENPYVKFLTTAVNFSNAWILTSVDSKCRSEYCLYQHSTLNRNKAVQKCFDSPAILVSVPACAQAVYKEHTCDRVFRCENFQNRYGNKVVGKPQTPGNPVVFLVFAAKSIPRNETLVDCISETARSINMKFGTQAPFYKNFRLCKIH